MIFDKDASSELCNRLVFGEDEDEDEVEFSITDVAPTLLRYAEKRFGRIEGRIEGGRLGSPGIRFKTLFDVKDQPGYCGASLEDVIEGRLGTHLWTFDHIIVYLVDGMGFRSFFRSGKGVLEVNPSIADMLTTFPSSTPVATTSLLTGAFPAGHGVVADRFFDMESKEMFIVKPYLSDNSKTELPRILPFTTYFLLGRAQPEEYSMGLITAGKSHSQAEGRRFLDFFFEDYFSVGGRYIKTAGNLDTFRQAMRYVKENQTKNTWVLFIRFTIDRLAHHFGPESSQVVTELSNVFEMIVSLNRELKSLYRPDTTLSLLVADHGHQDVPEGFVPFQSFKKFIEPNYRGVATNQKVLSLYYDFGHAMILKGISDPRLARVRKSGSEFYGYHWGDDSWRPLKPEGIERFATRQVSTERYGVDYAIGDLVINFDNFYVGGVGTGNSPNQVHLFKSTHGGLSYDEVRTPFLLWKT